MDDPHLVTMENSFQDLLDAVTGISFTVVLSCHDVFKELPTSDQIEDQVVEALFRDAVMEAYNVGMLQQAADPSFSLQFLVICQYPRIAGTRR